jgi:hypothetical protein
VLAAIPEWKAGEVAHFFSKHGAIERIKDITVSGTCLEVKSEALALHAPSRQDHMRVSSRPADA